MNCFPSPYKYNLPRVRVVLPAKGARILGRTNLKKRELIFNTILIVICNINIIHYKMI